MKYVYFGEIQSAIAAHYQRYETGMTFSEAVSYLRSNEQVHEAPPIIPDFYNWNTSELFRLKEFANQIPIFLDDVDQVDVTYSTADQTRTLSEHSHIQICLDSVYAPSGFTILPYITILYVLEGTASFSTPYEQLTLTAGSLLILSPQLPYRLFCTPADTVLNIISSKELFQENFSNILTQNTLLSNFFHQVFIENQKERLQFFLIPDLLTLDIIKHLFIEFISEDIFSTKVFLNYLQILYAHILRSCDFEIGRERSSQAKMTIIPAILLYIQKNYKTVSLEELSEKFNYAPAYISRLIKQETGQNLSTIKADLKLTAAKNLLQSTNFSIEKISDLSGYNSADHFSFSFKKKYQESPREYRKHQSF